MKKLILLFLFLSLNCLSQETILDCSGTFYRKSLSAKITIVPLTGGGEQQNTFPCSSLDVERIGVQYQINLQCHPQTL